MLANGEKTVLVLAAGLGSRYGGAKQWARFGPGHRTLLEYNLENAAVAGFRRAICVVREQDADILRAVTRSLGRFMDVDLAFQRLEDVPPGFQVPNGRAKPWGTAHAVHAARNGISGPFAIINGDDYYGKEPWLLLHRLSCIHPHCAATVAFRLKNTLSPAGTVSRGVCSLARDGRLNGVEEFLRIQKTGAIRDLLSGRVFSGEEPVSMNFWLLPAEFSDFLGEKAGHFFQSLTPQNQSDAEWLLPDAIGQWTQTGNGAAFTAISENPCCGLTHPSDGQRVEIAIAESTPIGQPGGGEH
jgi:hypothetical protein